MKSISQLVRDQVIAEAAQMVARDSMVYADRTIDQMGNTELLNRISDAIASQSRGEAKHAVAMGNAIILLRNWIKKHGKHGTDCYSKRNFERDCDCGLYEIRQNFTNDAAPEQALADDSATNRGAEHE